jgi:hypothetical protein
MFDNLVALVVVVFVFPSVVVFGLFRLAALKRADDFPPHVAEWSAPDLRAPK